jgi:hypothetical protein
LQTHSAAPPKDGETKPNQTEKQEHFQWIEEEAKAGKRGEQPRRFAITFEYAWRYR